MPRTTLNLAMMSSSLSRLIDPSGTVRWADLTVNYWVRARPETVLRIYDDLLPR